jgi:hypothetical protein
MPGRQLNFAPSILQLPRLSVITTFEEKRPATARGVGRRLRRDASYDSVHFGNHFIVFGGAQNSIGGDYIAAAIGHDIAASTTLSTIYAQWLKMLSVSVSRCRRFAR